MIIKRQKHWHMDVGVNGVRYREALHTTDRREVIMTYIKRGNRITLEMTQEEFDDVLEDAVKGAASR